jgi:hypothetical protein
MCAGATGTLVSPDIDLTGATGRLNLSFRYYQLGDGVPQRDMSSVEIWDGTKWSTLDVDRSDGRNLLDYGAWSVGSYNLTSYAGKTIKLRFTYSGLSESDNDPEGFYIDDVQVTATCLQCGATTDFNGDGKPDLLWRNAATGQTVVWLMNGTAYSSYQTISPTLADPNWKVAGVGGFDGNGATGILWRNSATGQDVIWSMNGANLSSFKNLAPSIADPN